VTGDERAIVDCGKQGHLNKKSQHSMGGEIDRFGGENRQRSNRLKNPGAERAVAIGKEKERTSENRKKLMMGKHIFKGKNDGG